MPWNRGTRALLAGGMAAGLLLGACSDDAEEGEVEAPEVGEGVEAEAEGEGEGLVEEEE